MPSLTHPSTLTPPKPNLAQVFATASPEGWGELQVFSLSSLSGVQRINRHSPYGAPRRVASQGDFIREELEAWLTVGAETWGMIDQYIDDLPDSEGDGTR